jgi:hypothetical protein
MMRFSIGSLLRLLTLFAAVVALAASATAPKVHVVDRKLRLRSDFDQTWSALIEVFAEHNWAIQNMEKDSGLITTDWMNLGADSTFADCGGAGIAGVVERQIRFNVFVRDADDDGTLVTVNTTFREERTWDRKNWFVDCTSTGRVESLIQGEMADAVASRRPRPRREQAPAATTPVPAGDVVPAVAPVVTPPAPPVEPAPAAGNAGGPCYGNQTCNAGLTCDDILGQCVAAP